MKGLLIKDFKLMKTQKRFYLLLLILAVVMTSYMESPTFVLGYLSFVIPMFALNTVSYDEFDNGNAFLFTLPISRKGYVYEKYLFGIILGTAALGLGVGLSAAASSLRGQPVGEIFSAAPPVYLVMLLFLAVMLPVQLRFGSEKGRLALPVIFGAVFLVTVGANEIFSFLKVDITPLLRWLEALDYRVGIAALAVFSALVLWVSSIISVKIMNKKEM